MATTNSQIEGLNAAGNISVDEVILITADGKEFDIRLYVSELNIFEDMFAPGLSGNILIIDNFNLSQKLGIIGDEFIRIKYHTPTMKDIITKTFKVYSVTDKIMTNDTARQSYIMHFCSPEIIIDSLSPIYRTFSGTVSDVVKKIFEEYVAISRNGGQDYTPLVLGRADNQVKFTSPGWRPFKCINWLASKALATDYNSPGFLFYESINRYYFVNLEQIYRSYNDANVVAQTYVYAPAGLADENYQLYVNNMDRQYMRVSEFRIVENFNTLKNSMNGYMANRIFTLDVVTKDYQTRDYTHLDDKNWYAYTHMEKNAIKPFTSRSSATLTNPAGFNQIAMQQFGLYTGVSNNVQDRAVEIIPRRTSVMAELTNFKIEITVPGRTDMEVGSMVNFVYPIAAPTDGSDKAKSNVDRLYTGKYLVTAIRHKIDLMRHTMVLELTKDSFDGSGLK